MLYAECICLLNNPTLCRVYDVCRTATRLVRALHITHLMLSAERTCLLNQFDVERLDALDA